MLKPANDIEATFWSITNMEDFRAWLSMDPPEPYIQDDWVKWCETRNKILLDYNKMEDLLNRVAPTSSISEIGLEEWFNQAKKLWKASTSYSSFVTKKSDNPAYDAIIAQGMFVVPIILKSFLINGSDHFFVALHEITGASPIPQEYLGNMKKMAYYWILWGLEYWENLKKENGIITADFTDLATIVGPIEDSLVLKRLAS